MNIYLEAEKELAIALGYTNFQRFESNGMPVSGSVDGVVTPLKQWTRSSAAAFDLMVVHGLAVYVDDHVQGCQCVEVEEYSNHSRILVNFSEHVDKATATRYAIVKAVIAKLKG